MSEPPDAKRDLLGALLQTADEAWSVVYDWAKEKIWAGDEEEEEEFPEEPQEATLVQQLDDLRIRLFAVNDAWNAHQRKHENLDTDQQRMWRDILVMNERLDALNKQDPPKPPTLIEKLEIQKLQQEAKMHDQQIDLLLEWKNTVQENFCTHEVVQMLLDRIAILERKEAERVSTSQGTGVQQIRLPVDDNVQSVRIWCQTSGTGCSDARDWSSAGNTIQAGKAGPDPSVEVGGPAAVQLAGGEHVSAADGGEQPPPVS